MGIAVSLNPVPVTYRLFALALLLLAGIAAGVVFGLTYESNRRDTQSLHQERADREVFNAALAKGKTHAANVIAWRKKAQTYYRNWKEALDHESDTQLAQCQTTDGAGTQQGGGNAVLLSHIWVGLYNAAWLPKFDAADDPDGTSYKIIDAGNASSGIGAGVTPREAINNIELNAWLCAEDRKRYDELIDYINEMGAR